VTFQYIHVALTNTTKEDYNPDSVIAIRSKENTQKTLDRIMGVLKDLSRLSNSSIRHETETEVQNLVNLARDISLQFGINTANLQLLVSHYGENVKIGNEYQDCVEGNEFNGSLVTVELLTLPGLQKIGNGRSDMETKKILIPAEVYAKQK
jgi:hypothetical protein